MRAPNAFQQIYRSILLHNGILRHEVRSSTFIHRTVFREFAIIPSCTSRCLRFMHHCSLDSILVRTRLPARNQLCSGAYLLLSTFAKNPRQRSKLDILSTIRGIAAATSARNVFTRTIFPGECRSSVATAKREH